ncbi:MAG: T9SS type A sorting domain-containing protein [Saprospiraceae bacterium]
MKFIRYFIFVGLVLLGLSVYGQQNLIKNGSFEERNIGYPNAPSTFNDIHATQDWRDNVFVVGNSSYNHSPDWIKADPNYYHHLYNNQVVQANTGEHYAGMLAGELIEQRINLQTYKAYKLSFYIRLTSSSSGNSRYATAAPSTGGGYYSNNYPNAKINILLAKNKIKYKKIGSGHCEAALTEYDKYFQKKDPVVVAASIPVDLTTYPADKWHRVETYLSKDVIYENLNWIGFEMVHDQTGNKVNEGWGLYCQSPYIYIDDVELYEVDCQECFNCSSKDGCINVQLSGNPQTGGCVTFTNLHNITRLKIELFEGGSKLVRTYDITNPPSEFSWDGKNNFGANVAGGTYFVKVTASNDCHTTFNVFSIVVPDGNWTCSGITNPIDGDRPPDGQCCGEDLYLNNITLTEDFVYRANRIFVGPNVIISNGVTIEFHAQSVIDISPNLIVENGADWTAYIDENCIEDDFTTGGGVGGGLVILPNPIIDDNEFDIDSLNHINDKLNKVDDINTNNITNVYPNPSNGIINIVLGDVKSSFIQVFDINGKLIKTRVSKEYKTRIDLTDYPKGLYFIKIRQGNIVTTQKLIIQ